jgi:hypothetical protein
MMLAMPVRERGTGGYRVSNFFSSLFGGANSDLNTDIGTTAQTAGFATGLGESNLTAGSDFNKALVSGDATKTSQVLAPVISAAKVSNAQTQKSNTEMGTRSGGTAASNNASSDKLHSDITNLTGSLTGKAADTLLSSGSSLLGTGLQATGMNEEFSQQRMENWSNSILGLGVTKGAGFAEGLGLNSIAGLAGKSGGNNNNDDNS